MKNIIGSSLTKAKHRGTILLFCTQLGCMSSTATQEELHQILSASKKQEEPKHRVTLDSIGPDGSHHINTKYIQETSDILLKEMKVFTQEDSVTAAKSGQKFIFNYKGPFETAEQTLYKKLNIDGRKQELEKVRAGGSEEKIENLKLECIKDILTELYKYPLIKGFHTVDNIVEDNKMLCIDKSVIFHEFLTNLNIAHSVGFLPGHSALIGHIGNKDYYIDATYNILKEIDSKTTKIGIYYQILSLYSKGNQIDQLFYDKNKNVEDGLLSQLLGNKGSESYESGNYKEAMLYFTKAIELETNNPSLYHSRGSTYGKLGQYDKAIEDYSQAIELEPISFIGYIERGVLYCKLGQYDKSLEDLSKAITLDPTNPLAYHNRGNLYASMFGQYDKAIEDLTKAIKRDNNNNSAIYYFDRGSCYGFLGQPEKFVQDRDKAKESNPSTELKNTIDSNPKYIKYKHLGMQQSLTQH